MSREQLCIKCINKVKNENSICTECMKYTVPNVNWEERKEELIKMVNSLRPKADKYDCIVSLSGGRDSSYALYYMSKVIGARVLALTWDNKFLRDTSLKNIENSTKILGIDHMVIDFNDEYVSKILMTLIKSTGNPCRGCIFLPPLKILPIAIEKKIPLIVTGFSSAQVGGIEHYSMVDQVYQKKMFNSYYKSFGKLFLTLLNHYHDKKTSLEIKDNLFEDMEKNVGKNAKIDFYPLTIALSRFTNWSPAEMDDILIKNLTWQRGRDGFEHTSCKIEEVRGYIEAKRNVVTMREEISYLVRTNKITRSQGLEEVRKLSLDGNKPGKEAITAFLNRFKLTEEEFNHYITIKTPLSMKLKLMILIPKLSKLMRWYQGFPTQLSIKQMYAYIKKVIYK